jgi:type IV conjugative transfer system protein TraL
MKEAIYPQYLNSPFKMLGMESDDMIIGFVAFGIGMLVQPMAGFLFAIAAVPLYRKAKRGKPRGFLQHLPYALGLKTFKGFDDVFVYRYGE